MILDPSIPIMDIALRLFASVGLSLAIGWEREANDKDAGIRTHMLVGLGACGFMLVTLSLTDPSLVQENGVSIDPSRVIQGLIGGIGFLGAGAIIHGGSDNVRGLTTGAGIWLVGAIGLACGSGAYILAIMMTAMALLVTIGCRVLLKPVIKQIKSDSD